MSTHTYSVPAVHNMKVKAGDTFRRTFTFTTDSAPQDLTGCLVTMEIFDSTGDVAKTLSVGSGFSIIGTDSNVLYLYSQWDIGEGSYTYEIQVTFTSGYVKTYFEGRIKAQYDKI